MGCIRGNPGWLSPKGLALALGGGLGVPSPRAPQSQRTQHLISFLSAQGLSQALAPGAPGSETKAAVAGW